ELASIAWEFRQRQPMSESSRQLALLRQAAGARTLGLSGRASTQLAEASQLPGPYRLAAVSELQLELSNGISPLPIFNIRQARSRPILDAVLDDDCWVHAEEVFLEAPRGASDQAKTLILMSWDQEFLYLAARCEAVSDQPLLPVTGERYHDADHGRRDRLTVTFDTDRDYDTAFEFVVDQSGQTSERCDLLTGWNPQWYVANAVDQAGWRIEAAIPLDSLTPQPVFAGHAWGIRLSREIPGVFSQRLCGEQELPIELNGAGVMRFIRPPRTR
ncbi:MAG: hypothetical protein KDA85_15740, partial [Planctomycetaceae bacterium]|nr:hypothetical protein [Planctomycetaceae bacterium]